MRKTWEDSRLGARQESEKVIEWLRTAHLSLSGKANPDWRMGELDRVNESLEVWDLKAGKSNPLNYRMLAIGEASEVVDEVVYYWSEPG